MRLGLRVPRGTSRRPSTRPDRWHAGPAHIGCRNRASSDDGEVVSETLMDVPDQRRVLVALYDSALPEVYGYLAVALRAAAVAEDLTTETFLAAIDAVPARGTRRT